MARRSWFSPRRPAAPLPPVSSSEQADSEPRRRPTKRLRGYIDASDDVAKQLREATATLIAGACRSLPHALTDERRLEQPVDSLDEFFQIVLLRTLFVLLGRPNGSGRVTIDATEHFRPLLERALKIARNATAKDLRSATTAQRRHQATSRAVELQIIARQLASADCSRAASGADDRS